LSQPAAGGIVYEYGAEYVPSGKRDSRFGHSRPGFPRFLNNSSRCASSYCARRYLALPRRNAGECTAKEHGKYNIRRDIRAPAFSVFSPFYHDV